MNLLIMQEAANESCEAYLSLGDAQSQHLREAGRHCAHYDANVQPEFWCFDEERGTDHCLEDRFYEIMMCSQTGIGVRACLP